MYVSLRWAWPTSKRLGFNLKLRAKFLAAAIRHPSLVQEIKAADPTSAFGVLTEEWPDTVGCLLWPYQCASWDPDERFSRIRRHLDVLERFPGLKLGPEEKLVLLDLSRISDDVYVIIDRAKWLAREGHLTLSLFKGDFRAFTISFSLSSGADLELFIGGIQGRQGEQMLSLYRDLTKDFHGMRPRDLMLEVLRIFANAIGVKHIYAVADAFKVSRHKYFGERGAPGLFYDDIWEERGGTRIDECRFELPLDGNRRDLEEIAAKKRSMYRKRYEMLDNLAASIPTDLSTAQRKHFDAK